MPPQSLSLEQIGILIGIVGTLGIGFVWLFNMWIIQPLTKSMDGLSDEIKEFKSASHLEHLDFLDRFNKLDSRLDKHDRKIDVLANDMDNLKEKVK